MRRGWTDLEAVYLDWIHCFIRKVKVFCEKTRIDGELQQSVFLLFILRILQKNDCKGWKLVRYRSMLLTRE